MIPDETFDAIANELNQNTIAYDLGTVKHMKYAERVEQIFANYRTTKQAFYTELNKRLGLKETEKATTSEKKKRKVKVTIA